MMFTKQSIILQVSHLYGMVFDAIRELVIPPDKPQRKIGFKGGE